MAFFVLFGLIVFLGMRGKEPTRQAYALVAVATLTASLWELLKP